jgi:L-aminopeptidase/D-esterase-like protein
MAKRACAQASDGPAAEGRIGAGTGATVGKYFGQSRSMKGGVGTWSERISGGVTVGALVVVNAFGDVVDPSSMEIIAGTLSEDRKRFENTSRLMKKKGAGPVLTRFFNTTLAVVATDARLNKEGTVKVAQMAHDGFARTISPVHTMVDGDIIYTLSTGKKKADVSTVGVTAADVVAQAVVRAVSRGNKQR